MFEPNDPLDISYGIDCICHLLADDDFPEYVTIPDTNIKIYRNDYVRPAIYYTVYVKNEHVFELKWRDPVGDLKRLRVGGWITHLHAYARDLAEEEAPQVFEIRRAIDAYENSAFEPIDDADLIPANPNALGE